MINTAERQADILNIIERLDISPSMYKNADEKYHALASFLEGCGIDAEIYPQGSFALGTVVRPVTKNPDAGYDLDFICQVRQTKDQISPSDLRKTIQEALESNDRYASRLKVCKECYTIEYADIGEVSFAIDIVPAADESNAHKQELGSKSQRPDLIDTAIAIPRHNGDRNYSWMTNNPHGFRTWFDEINRPFLEHGQTDRLRRLFEANRHVFTSVEDIPKELDRSAMQRVIQILKHHRDVYYLSLKDGDNLKPISAIINTLVAEISKAADPMLDVFGLLQFVLGELNIYAQHQNLGNDQFAQQYGSRSVIRREEGTGKWLIQNPTNPEDNLADKWNENSAIPQCFFRWIKACTEDLIGSLSLPDSEFRTAVENAFGTDVVKSNWADKYNHVPTVPRAITTAPRPFQR